MLIGTGAIFKKKLIEEHVTHAHHSLLLNILGVIIIINDNFTRSTM